MTGQSLAKEIANHPGRVYLRAPPTDTPSRLHGRRVRMQATWPNRTSNGRGGIVVAEKTLRFQGKNRDLALLPQEIEGTLRSQGYKTQSTAMPSGRVVQARKGGILSDLVTAERAFTILLTGQPDDFSIRVGIGKLVQNLAVLAAESIPLSGLFLGIDVPEMLWTRHVEKGLIDEIRQLIG